MKISEAIRAAVPQLAEVGIETASQDARRLLADVLDATPDQLSLHPAQLLTPKQQSAFWNRITARKLRKPVSQILGRRMFWGRQFRVTADTLDPRPETECLIEAALRIPFSTVLDLGTGTGCILLSLLAERPQVTGLGTDLSDAALAVAGQNARELGLDGRVRFQVSDWLAQVQGRFDLIISNPPYITDAEMADLQPEVHDWEPHLALTPGGDGLAAYRAITAAAAAHLFPGGQLVLEIGATQGPAVSDLLRQAGFTQADICQDFDDRDRVVIARL